MNHVVLIGQPAMLPIYVRAAALSTQLICAALVDIAKHY